MEPEEVLSVATDEYGVRDIDDRNFKLMVNYIADAYSMQELRDIAARERLRVAPRDTKKTITRKLLIDLLDEGASYINVSHRPRNYVQDYERLHY
jgi:hypothetical protein